MSSMLLRLLTGSWKHRKARLMVVVAALLLGTIMVSALSHLSLTISSQAGAQLRAYGANIVLLPQTTSSPLGTGAPEEYIEEEDLASLSSGEIAPYLAGYVPYLYSLVRVSDQQIVLAGTWFDAVRQVMPYWEVEGAWIESRDDTQSAMVGSQVAEKLKLKPGDIITLQRGQTLRSFTVTGIVETGASENSQVFLTLQAAQEMTAHPGKVSLAQISAWRGKLSLEKIASLLEKQIPWSEARVVGQVAQAEVLIMHKVQFLIALVAAFLLVASGLVALSTMTNTVLERTREIGIMKALGATDRRIAVLFGAEVGTIALAGGVLGFVLGYFLAQLIVQRVFSSSLSPHPIAFLVTVIIALAVSFLSSAFPLRRAMRIDPAIILRGE